LQVSASAPLHTWGLSEAGNWRGRLPVWHDADIYCPSSGSFEIPPEWESHGFFQLLASTSWPQYAVNNDRRMWYVTLA
jgi:hypothetical protein